ncbi:hypothetical protein [Enorma burkinafasonensis]|uniref:hypothetical protein n=1 Tax=Enorma burkinafasonensis TaxID=2590867 RepID=UPI0011A9BD89|nr:hypothetical protein [Enorma burkinafasonensis]
MSEMTFTSASAAKYIKSLEDEKARLLSRERENATYVLAQGEEEMPPEYDYERTFAEVDEIDRKVRLVRHALHAFNAVTLIPEEGMTIDEALVLMAQLNNKLRRLDALRSHEPKRRRESGMFRGNAVIEYEYANYDVKRAAEDYRVLYDRIAELQLRLDLVNQTERFSVDL